MPPGLLKTRPADLKVMPVASAADPGTKHVAVGDLHGNTLKLIYTLIDEGIMQLHDAAADYQQLYTIYMKQSLTKADINSFKAIIARSVIKTDKSVTLIGDELADRGSNDFLTLLMFQKMSESGLDFDITLSNHSAEFIYRFEKDFLRPSSELNSQGGSFNRMAVLIRGGIVKTSEIKNLTNKYYKPHLKALSYTLDEGGFLTVYTHAPVGFETIQALASKYEINCPVTFKSPQELMNIIDQINDCFSKKVNKNESGVTEDKETQRHQFIKRGSGKIDTNIDSKYPFARLTWNRATGEDPHMQPIVPGLEGQVGWVHGHVGPRGSVFSGTHVNVDNDLGKTWPVYGEGSQVIKYENNEEASQYPTHCSSGLTKHKLVYDKYHKALGSFKGQFTALTQEYGQIGQDLTSDERNKVNRATRLIGELEILINTQHRTPAFKKKFDERVKNAAWIFSDEKSWFKYKLSRMFKCFRRECDSSDAGTPLLAAGEKGDIKSRLMSMKALLEVDKPRADGINNEVQLTKY